MAHRDPMDVLISVLSIMKGEQKWTEAHVEAYLIGLTKLPAEIVPMLCREIQAHFDWRPSVKQIIDWSKQLTSPNALLGPTEALEKVTGLMHKYGPNASLHPQFPDCPQIRAAGPPPELDNAPDAVHSVIGAMGGWVAMCREDVASKDFRAQFERLYKSAVLDEGMDRTRELQLEYREEKLRLQSERGINIGESRTPLEVVGGGMGRLGAVMPKIGRV